MVDFSWWGGARVTPWMRYQLDRLDADLRREFGVGLVANSGIRLAQEQLDIWYARYTRTPNGRKVYDTRWWNGQLWYRVSPDGTVAQPGSSNHEIQGTTAAVDIADTGSDAGIKSSWSTRGKWIRANAWRYDMVASGDGFGEGWHFDIRNIYNNPPGSPAGGGATPIKKEWDEMATEQDLENVVRRVLGDGKTNEHFIVSYASQTGRNGIVLAGFGYWHPLTGEQWEHFNWNGSFSPQGGGLFNGLRVFTPINDRAWDILRDICLNDGVAEGEGVDYDKIEKLVTEGKVEPVTPVIDYAQLAKAMQDAGVTNANSADIAKAVRAELASNPLK